MTEVVYLMILVVFVARESRGGSCQDCGVPVAQGDGLAGRSGEAVWFTNPPRERGKPALAHEDLSCG